MLTRFSGPCTVQRLPRRSKGFVSRRDRWIGDRIPRRGDGVGAQGARDPWAGSGTMRTGRWVAFSQDGCRRQRFHPTLNRQLPAWSVVRPCYQRPTPRPPLTAISIRTPRRRWRSIRGSLACRPDTGLTLSCTTPRPPAAASKASMRPICSDETRTATRGWGSATTLSWATATAWGTARLSRRFAGGNNCRGLTRAKTSTTSTASGLRWSATSTWDRPAPHKSTRCVV